MDLIIIPISLVLFIRQHIFFLLFSFFFLFQDRAGIGRRPGSFLETLIGLQKQPPRVGPARRGCAGPLYAKGLSEEVSEESNTGSEKQQRYTE